MAVSISTVDLYLNVFTKALVSVNGSPTIVPTQYYGDTPTFRVFPVIPAGNNPAQGYVAIDLSVYTMNLTMADTPNAASPPTPFASLDGMTWNGSISGFVGVIDITQAAVGTFLGSNATKPAFFNLDVFDATLKRTTLIQTTFTLSASIDTVVVQPAGPPVVYITLQQALGMFVQVGPVPGKQIIWQSPTTGIKRQQTLGDDGAMQDNPL